MQDKQVAAGNRSPYFRVINVITYFDSSTETKTFDHVTLHGYNFDANGAMDELGEKFDGFAGIRNVEWGGNALGDVSAAQTAVANAISAIDDVLQLNIQAGTIGSADYYKDNGSTNG